MLNVNILSFQSYQYLRLIFTALQLSCGKVMLLLTYVCSQGGGGYAWSQVPLWGRGIQMEDGYARGGYPIGRVSKLGMSIQEGETRVSKREDGYTRGAGIQEVGWVYWGTGIEEEGDRYPRGKVGMTRGLGIQERGDGVSKTVH